MIGLLIGAGIGYLTGGVLGAGSATWILTGAAVGAQVGRSFYDQPKSIKKAQEESKDASLAAAEEQARVAGQMRGVAMAPISEEQMQKVMKQREVDSLVDHYIEQDQQAPRIYTLPTAEKSSPIDRINDAIHNLITGAA